MASARHVHHAPFGRVSLAAAAIFTLLLGSACSSAATAPPVPIPTATAAALATSTPVPSPTPTELPPASTPSPVPTATVAPPRPGTIQGFQTAFGGREIIRGRADDPRVALTFDCGSVAGASSRILDVLHEAQLKVTIFMTGQYAHRYPELMQRMAAEGHEFANHSYFHPNFTQMGNEGILSELARTDEAVQGVTGVSTKPWMRMPFGARDPRVMDIVSGAGYSSIFWTLDSGDWQQGATVASVRSRVLEGVKPGAIVVHHCAAGQTAGALPDILAGLSGKGLQVVTISELLKG
ncbi:MAG: hypothetical protein EXR51_04065 [Dehalococcoidia bacterium]|nr:hypothetical protein [Dehalococcoidia bacterium]